MKPKKREKHRGRKKENEIKKKQKTRECGRTEGKSETGRKN
jgi:hypothetical protein